MAGEAKVPGSMVASDLPDDPREMAEALERVLELARRWRAGSTRAGLVAAAELEDALRGEL